MPECENCGGHVTHDYLRVKGRQGEDGVRACPNCPDKLWVNGKVRDTKS